MNAFAARDWRSTDGLRLFARDYAGASGPARLPVVCLHGLTRNSRDFEEVAPRLAEAGRRILVPDVRGRGRSDRDPQAANYHFGTYAADVLALLDALGIARALFIGTSMGGLIIMTLATLAPERIAAAVLNDIGPEISPAGLTRITRYVEQPITAGSWAEAADYVRRANEIAFPRYDADDWTRFARRLFREDAADRLTLDYDPAIARAFPAPTATAPDLWPLFDALAANRPLLLVRGMLSDLIDDAVAARMQARAPHMRQALVPNVGHAPMLTEPEARPAIEAFLDAVP